MSTHIAHTLAAEIMARALRSPRSEPDIRPIGEFEAVPECRVLYRDGKPAADVLVDRPVLRLPLNVVLLPGAGPYIPRADEQKGLRVPQARRVAAASKPKPKPRRVVKIDGFAVLEMRKGGAQYTEIAQRLGCSASHLHRQLSELRISSIEFREADRAAHTCPYCKALMTSPGPRCGKCRRYKVGDPKQPRHVANRRDDITAAVILSAWRAGKSTLDIARESPCDPKTVHRVIAQARTADPAVDAEYLALRLCKCGRSKAAWTSRCARCGKHEQARRVPRPDAETGIGSIEGDKVTV